jgi:S1-C subfamily serine protease
VLGRDPAADLAAIQVAVTLDRLSPLELGDSDGVQRGEPVVLISNPLGRSQAVTAGLVSAVDRPAPGADGRPIGGLIQTDVPFGPGDVGGPLLNGRSQVVGLATTARPNPNATGPCQALPINAARRLLPRLQAGETIRRAYLGLSGRDLTPTLAQALGLPAQSGVIVSELVGNGPAAVAGLRASPVPQDRLGGDIILALDGQEVRRLDDLTRLVDAKQPGDRVTLLVRRGSAQLTVPVVLGDWPG